MSKQGNILVAASIATLVALGGALASGAALAAQGDMEKCAGIVRAGKNDCGTSRSACAGTSAMDRDLEAWILVPKGTCARIAGGRRQEGRPRRPFQDFAGAINMHYVNNPMELPTAAARGRAGAGTGPARGLELMQ